MSITAALTVPPAALLHAVVVALALLIALGVWFPGRASDLFMLTRIAPDQPTSPWHRAARRNWTRIRRVRSYVPLVLAVAAGSSADWLLLAHANTLVWPYLWVKPGLFVLVACFALCLCIPEIFVGVLSLRVVGAVMIFVGECYLLHSLTVAQHDPSPLAVIHLLGVAGTFGVMVLGYVNQVAPKNNTQAPPLPTDLPSIAAIVPTFGEPLDVLDVTLAALTRLDYAPDRIHILVADDGHREEVRTLAERHAVDYIQGPRRDAKAGNLNAALTHLSETVPQARLVLTQDADEVINPTFLRQTVGYFSDPSIAFVQTPKDAVTPSGDPFGTRDRIFYDAIQPGRNGAGAAISCGSGVLWRTDAVVAVGGFATWNIVEDLTTSYLLHSAGYRSEYHNEHLSVGLAPDDIPGLLKQRGTWALDTWRLFLFDNPLCKPGLSLRQRLQYLELCLFYVTSAFFTPLLMLVPLLSLATGRFIAIEASALIPWVLASFLYYLAASQGGTPFLIRTLQYRISHWPTYVQAFWVAVRSRREKPRYVVTRKMRQDGFYAHLLWPQFLFLIAGLAISLRAILWMPTANPANRAANVVVLAYFLFMVSGICRAAFHGLRPRFVLKTHALAGRLAEYGGRLFGRQGDEVSVLAATRDNELETGR